MKKLLLVLPILVLMTVACNRESKKIWFVSDEGEKVIATVTPEGDTVFYTKDSTEEIYRKNGVHDFSNKWESTFKHGPYKYLVVNNSRFILLDTVYETYENYVWGHVFPDSIIVRFTRNGKFEMYVTAEKSGDDIKDKEGNPISPIYVFHDVVGHSWLYNIKGEFLEFAESPFPHNNSGEEPYKP